jgi:hypothetical protein
MRGDWWRPGEPIQLPGRASVTTPMRLTWALSTDEEREHAVAYALRRDPLPNELGTFDEAFVSVRNEQPSFGLTALREGLADARAA